MILLSYLGAHWTLFVCVVLAAVALSAASWFLKNWKLAAGAIVLVVFGLAYQASNMDGYKRKVAEDAQAQVRVLQNRLLTLTVVAEQDAARAKEDSDTIAKLEALSRETPHNDGVCLDADAARRVRAIAGGSKPVTTPVPARRHSIVLPWRHGRP